MDVFPNVQNGERADGVPAILEDIVKNMITPLADNVKREWSRVWGVFFLECVVWSS